MGLLYIALFGIGVFGIMTFLRRWADSFVMIAFAIGAVVAANLYNAGTAPVVVADGALVFSIDSILYTLFIHLVAVKYLHYSNREARLFVYSSLVAILLSAIFEFSAGAIAYGYSTQLLYKFLGYIFSIVGSLAGIALMELFFKFTVKKRISNYISLPIGIIIACFLNSTIYYGLSYFIDKSIFDNFVPALLGSWIGKFYAIGLAELSYFINSEKIWFPHELIRKRQLEKEKEKILNSLDEKK